MRVKTKIRIALDLDGVMCNWLKGCCDVCGLNENDKFLREEMKSGKDMQEIVYTHFTKRDKQDMVSKYLVEQDMWDKITKIGSSWWTQLHVLPWAHDLYFGLYDLKQDFVFLSSPGDMYNFPEFVPLACKGKMEWVHDYFPLSSLILCRDKHLFATPNSLLIDDSKKKIDDFIEYGGQGFLWPNQYKLMDGDISLDDTLKELEEKIKNMLL